MASNVKYVDFVLDEGAQRPIKKHAGDAGWDLFTSEECVINPGETKDVHTGVRMNMPPFLFARITGRSSSLRKYNLLINEGIIDNGYTGELFVCAHNLGDKPITIEKGMRVAQVLFHSIEDVRWCEVEELKPSPDKRGDAGFGSTGK
jgi:dUTP pyrophosphatase